MKTTRFSKVLICAFTLLVFCINANAQSSISGSINDNSNAPLAYANVLLRMLSDSSLVKGQITNESGAYKIENIAPGQYFVEISMVGKGVERTAVFNLANNEQKVLPNIQLRENTELAAVSVVAQKNLFEQKVDRLVINVENSITSAGANALELLERAPGVVVNRQNNQISIAGKQGVVVMINGKLNYMSADAVVNMLAGMPAGNISKIEILSTPPANLDAEGNAGYINIVLKTNQGDGFNGSYTLVGKYGPNADGYNLSANINYRKNKWNYYATYSYSYERFDNPFNFYRRFADASGNEIATSSISDRRPSDTRHNFRTGVDFQLNKKTVMGVLVTAYDTKWVMSADNIATFTTNNAVDSFITVRGHEINEWQHLGSNFNIQHTIAENNVINFDVDYLYYIDDNPNDYFNRFLNSDNSEKRSQTTRSTKVTPISIGVAKLDWTRPIGKNSKIELGVKGIYSQFKNDVAVEYLGPEDWLPDPFFTAKYKLNESILAAYSSYETKINTKTTLKAGLRYEHTNSNLGSEEQANIVDRQYGLFFPSVFVNHNLSETQSVNFSYSKRITRPTFNNLAPFVIFTDPSTFFAGNAALQPAIAHSLKFDFKRKSLLISLQYTKEDSTIARFQPVLDTINNRQYTTATNLKGQQTYAFTIGMPVSITKWWNCYATTTLSYVVVDAVLYGQIVRFEAPAVNLFSSQNFTLPKNFGIDVSGFYNYGGFFGASFTKPLGALNAAAQKKFTKQNSSISFGVDNILNTLVFRSETDLQAQAQYFTAHLQFGWPQAKLTYKKNFGSQSAKAARDRELKSDRIE